MASPGRLARMASLGGCRFLVGVGLAWVVVLGGWRSALALELEGRVRLQRVALPFSVDRPVQWLPWAGQQGRMLLVQQDGLVRWVGRAGGEKRQHGVFLDLRQRVRAGGEEGLLSIIFSPKQPWLFAYYTPAEGRRRSVLARFPLDPSGKPRVKQEVSVLEVSQPYANHNGGLLQFGIHNYLYVGLGDGGSGGDPHGHGQNTNTLLGSILRIDVHRPPAKDSEQIDEEYAIPAFNPFADPAIGMGRKEIWAYGFRNPWRGALDLQTGIFLVGDVGQNRLEEVDHVIRGGNYGWSVMEGSRCYRPSRGCDKFGMFPPLTEYPHSAGRSVTGGEFYRGKQLPFLTNRYLFGDFVSGTLWHVPVTSVRTVEPEVLLRTKLALSSFGKDAAGEVYVVDYRGGVYQLVAETR